MRVANSTSSSRARQAHLLGPAWVTNTAFASSGVFERMSDAFCPWRSNSVFDEHAGSGYDTNSVSLYQARGVELVILARLPGR